MFTEQELTSILECRTSLTAKYIVDNRLAAVTHVWKCAAWMFSQVSTTEHENEALKLLAGRPTDLHDWEERMWGGLPPRLSGVGGDD